MEVESGLRGQSGVGGKEDSVILMAASHHPRCLWLSHRGWRGHNGRFSTASALNGWLDHGFEGLLFVGRIQLSVWQKEEAIEGLWGMV